MTTSYQIGQVGADFIGGGPGAGGLAPWPYPQLILHWDALDTLLEIWHPGHDVPGDPDFELLLPKATSKTENIGNWNKTPSIRRSQHILVGQNTAGIERHAILVNIRFDDVGSPGRQPYLFIWDWRAGTTYGPLFLGSATRYLAGPIKIAGLLYFVAVAEADLKARLYQTSCTLGTPVQIGDATDPINSSLSIEHLVASGDHIGFAVSPFSGLYSKAWAWDYVTPGGPFEPTSVTCGAFNYFYSREVANTPGVKLATDDSFFLVNNVPFSMDTLDATEYTMSQLRGVGSWGITESIGSNEAPRSQVISDDGNDVFLSYQGELQKWYYQERVWRTGSVITAETVYEEDGVVPIGQASHMYPFTT